jgi:hypothetical protein
MPGSGGTTKRFAPVSAAGLNINALQEIQALLNPTNLQLLQAIQTLNANIKSIQSQLQAIQAQVNSTDANVKNSFYAMTTWEHDYFMFMLNNIGGMVWSCIMSNGKTMNYQGDYDFMPTSSPQPTWQ